MNKTLLGFIAIGLLTFVGCEKEKQKGCMEPNAINFDSAAEENDGSCRYVEDNNNDTNTNTDQDSTRTNNGGTDTDSTDTNVGDDGTTNNNEGTDTDSGDGITDTTSTSSDDESTDTDSGDETIDTTSTSSSVEYGDGATDIIGNSYQSVIIAEQEWMAENLRTSKYSDGTAIPNVTDNNEWRYLSSGAWSHYENDSSQYEATYGKLYNWYAVETGKLCPTGWHVPTDAEWTVLKDYLSSNESSGADLKSTSGWGASKNGTDSYGWKAFPGGFRRIYSEFEEIGNFAFWWASNATGMGDGRGVSLEYDDMNQVEEDKVRGHSVRCLKD